MTLLRGRLPGYRPAYMTAFLTVRLRHLLARASSHQRLKQVTDGDLDRRRTPRFNDESVLNYVFASFWPPNISHALLSPRYVGPDLLKRPPYVNCGAQIPPAEIRIMHLEKCHQVALSGASAALVSTSACRKPRHIARPFCAQAAPLCQTTLAFRQRSPSSAASFLSLLACGQGGMPGGMARVAWEPSADWRLLGCTPKQGDVKR